MNKIIHGDCIEKLRSIEIGTIDTIFADPPYYLSNGGLSYNSGKVVSVNKGDWDKYTSKNDIYNFTKSWLIESKRVLKGNGSIFISGTHHNIFIVGNVLKELGYTVVNFITWEKLDPPPLIYKNKLRFSAEHIIWAKPNKKHKFNYQLMYNVDEKEMTDVWKLSAVKVYEKKHGKHPTQKPIELLKRIILATTKKNDVVLDPFMGSGTTCVAAKQLGRQYIGIEQNEEYFNLAKRRLSDK